ncbi:MAG TPA: ATP-binding protein [Rubrivivax sp.]|nr:ATP-binding protein [Rubrivivax sp.]
MTSHTAPPLPTPASKPPVAGAPGAAAPLISLRVFAVLCVLVPLAIYAAVGAWRYKQLRAETDVRLDRSLRIAQEHALKIFEVNEGLLDRLSDVLGEQSGAALKQQEAEVHRQLPALSAGKPQIHSLWIHDAEGRAVASDQAPAAPSSLSVADRDYFAWHRQHRGGTFISGPLVGRASGRPFFGMSRGRYLADGSFAGVIMVAVSPKYFENFYGNLVNDEPGMAITMLRSDGTILTRSPVLAEAPPRLAANSPVMSRISQGEKEGVVSGVSSVDGKRRRLAFRQIGDFPAFVGTGMDLGKVRDNWAREMAWLAAFGLPPMVGLFLVGRVALRRAREAVEVAQRLREESVARERVEQSLLQAQKLEALGRLTGGVAHDFNNAMMVISNSLYLLKRRHPGLDLPEVEPIGRAVDSATKLTRQLLAFSRRQALMPQHTRLQERLPQLEALLGPVLGSLSRLKMSVHADTAPILIDAAEFELALLNLAINARDAMPGGGDLGIAARNATTLPPNLKGKFVLVEVSDTGQGIDPACIDKVFEPFFTTKPVGEGTGLGLSQVYGLCQRAGGHATIRSRLGAGTTVSLYFPAATGPAVETIGAATTTDRPGLGLFVLLVEDNPEVADSVQDVLSSLSCRVEWLPRADEARTWLHSQAQLPDVLLSDVVMPGEMDGMALAHHVRARYPAIRIVLMTGHAAQLSALSADGFVVLPKPCSADALAATLAAGAPAPR